jgi:hypothetical protein
MRLRTLLLTGAGLAGGLIGALAVGAIVWTAETGRLTARLRTRSEREAAYSRDDLAGLPDPVVRYFDFALTPGQSLVRGARLRQTGAMALRPDSWSRFTATEYFGVDPPGFVWEAKIHVAPLVSVHVRDGYWAGEGTMTGKLAAIVPVVDEHGTPEMASAELLRYLAEAVLLPTALLPRHGIAWTTVDDRTARATITDAGVTVSCDVSFGEQNQIEGVRAMRYRDVDGKPVFVPWVGHFDDYRRIDGMMIPMLADVEWELAGKKVPYWRGRVDEARFEFAQ